MRIGVTIRSAFWRRSRSHGVTHRQKRRVLPLRPPPISTAHDFVFQNFALAAASSAYRQPTTLTPVDSDEESAKSSASPPQIFLSSPPPHPPSTNPSSFSSHIPEQISIINNDVHQPNPDYDMSDTLPVPISMAPLHSPPSFILSPPSVHVRLPTPIFGSFFLNPPSSHQGSEMSIVEDEDLDCSDPTTQYRHLERRRLPSPISEGEDGLLSPMTGAGEMMERLGVGAGPRRDSTDSSRGRLGDGEDGVDGMEVEGDDSMESQLGDRQRRGRSRSRRADGKDAIPGDGSRPVLSMGYRADCERCRARVPGHYTHVLRG